MQPLTDDVKVLPVGMENWRYKEENGIYLVISTASKYPSGEPSNERCAVIHSLIACLGIGRFFL